MSQHRLTLSSAPQSPALRGLDFSQNGPSSPRQPSVKVSQPSSTFPNAQRTKSSRIADLVQEMYLRELKAYKPTPVKASDSEGHVQKFSVPKTPKSPEETDIANELKAYEASTVDLQGAEGSEEGAAPIDQDWFEEEEEEHAKAH
jgi:F-type H+-transporting ATPase subunit h